MDRSQQGETRHAAPGTARRRASIARLALAATGLVLLAGCDWAHLAWGAFMYPVTGATEAANVAADGRFAYTTRAADGIEVINLGAPARRYVIAPPRGTTVDDLAIADGLLFALDARPPGGLAVYSLADPAHPALVQAPVAVEVGPFSGVSAAAGRVVVSGGTSRLTVHRYASDGKLSDILTTADLGRGQPDVLLAPDGRHAYVSVHDGGPRFSLVVLALDGDPLATRAIAAIPLDTTGFTPGGAKPANFPIEMAQDGARLFIASAAGLQVFDVADPAQPRPLATIEAGALPVNVDARDGIAAVVGSDPEPTLTLVDLADSASPKVIRSIRLPEGSRATGVALTGRQVVVAAEAAGTLVFNLDDLTE